VLVPGCGHEAALLEQLGFSATVCRLLTPGGWLLGLFWCHRKPGGPPWGSDPEVVAAQLGQAGLVAELWEPAAGSVDQRQDEWIGLWRLSSPSP
jgi:thiopurine S-methyltransferase